MVLNSLGKKFNSPVLKDLSLETFLEMVICADSKTSEYRKLTCLSSKTRTSCLVHDSRNAKCQDCTHTCSNQIFEEIVKILNKFCQEKIRYPRFIPIDGKMTYVSVRG